MANVVRGCRDLLGSTIHTRSTVLSRFNSICSTYAYKPIETPILEHVDIFSKNLGSTSDIMVSEMYHLLNTDPQLVLRPEGTASVARALSKGRLLSMRANGTRVYYIGPMFRRERPQAGRLRQFTQLGVECIADNTISADTEVIQLASIFLSHYNAYNKLRINTLGTQNERKQFEEVLKGYLKPRYLAMSNISRKRFDKGHCMRIFDSKLPEDEDVLRGAPQLHEYIGHDERNRFEELKALLEESNIDFEVDYRLVRGLEYYTSTAFEFDGNFGKAVCAGGRYENVEGVNGIGFAIGLERLEMEMGIEQNSFATELENELDGGVAVIGLDKYAERSDNQIGKSVRQLTQQLRSKGVRTVMRLNYGRLNKVIGRAIKSGASIIIVIGEDDLNDNQAKVKLVREDGTNSLESVDLDNVADYVTTKMNDFETSIEKKKLYL